MDAVETEGNSIDDAIANALSRLGTTRDRVEVEILSNAARGFLGFGGRKARVRVTLRVPLGAGDTLAPLVPSANTVVDVADASVPREPSGADEGRHAAERVAALMRQVIPHLGVTAEVSVGRTDDGQFVLDLKGDTTGVLIGRRGQMLDALEYVMNRVVAREGGEGTRITLDAENYRARRREALESMARRSAAEAKKKGKPITLNPMTPRDRRIVHVVLKDDPSLTTRSAGMGYLRKLVIVPAGAERKRRPAHRPPQA